MIITHLGWSLLGAADLETLNSVDSSSVGLAHALYAVFLIMGVILLVNMLIALLSNTYQKVQVIRFFPVLDFVPNELHRTILVESFYWDLITQRSPHELK